MSTNLATARPRLGWTGPVVPKPADEEPRPQLEVVSTRSQRRARPRTVYAMISVSILLVIVTAQLLLSIAMTQGAYQINTLQTTTKQLQRSYQVASEDLDRLSSPQNLAANANALGMVSNSNPVYLRLSDGAVLGTPIPAQASNGTVTGSAGNLVPNSLLAGIALVTAKPKTPATAPTSTTNPGTASAPGTTTAPPPIPLGDALPSPVTH
jgi:hypothetical protein